MDDNDMLTLFELKTMPASRLFEITAQNLNGDAISDQVIIKLIDSLLNMVRLM